MSLFDDYEEMRPSVVPAVVFHTRVRMSQLKDQIHIVGKRLPHTIISGERGLLFSRCLERLPQLAQHINCLALKKSLMNSRHWVLMKSIAYQSMMPL